MKRHATTRAEWLCREEEIRHARIVTVNQGLTITPSLYFGTRRCTYSDVMSVVTTVKRLPRFQHDTQLSPNSTTTATSTTTTKKNKKPPPVKSAWEMPPAPALAKQPSRRDPELVDTNGTSLYVQAPLEGDSTRDARFLARQSHALHQERNAFLTTLRARRWQRFVQEHQAALVVQRVYRGFLLRRRFLVIKEKLRVRKRIRLNLVKVTKGTAIITGEKDRKARILTAQHAAARKIQLCFARWRAWRLRYRERALRHQELRHKCAVVIQRVWHRALALAASRKLRARFVHQQCQRLARLLTRVYQGFCARQRVRRIRLRRHVRASQTIQRAVLCFHARKALALQRQHHRERIANRAAVQIQRVYRGVAARAQVIQIRLKEDHAIQVACALAIQRVFRGSRGRHRVRFHRVFHAHALAWRCGLHLTRVVRGFLARRRVQMEMLDQETDVLVQTVRGTTSTVIDLLDGYGIVDEPVELAVTRYETKNNLLHLAARHGRMEILTHVLPKFLDAARDQIYAVNANGETPLELAICHGHEQLASFLLARTSDLFPTTLHARHVARSTSGGGTNSKRERSLVLEAARHGMGAIVAKLVALFPQFYDGKERDAWSKRTVLHEALLSLRVRTAHDSKAASGNSELKCVALQTILAKLPNLDVNAQDLVGFTPLHVAAMRGDLQAVTRLLDHGADVTIQDREARTAWRLALLHGHEACFLEIRRKWLCNVSTGDAEVSTESTETSEAGGHALVDAAAKSRPVYYHTNMQPHLAKDLVQAGRVGNNERVIFLLEEFHASVNASDPENDGDSLLMVVVGQKNVRLLRYLLANYDTQQFAISYVDNHGRSAVDVALQSPLLLRMLIRRGLVNPCLPLDSARQHRTVCHEAVRRGYNLRDWVHSGGYTCMASMFVPLVDDTGRSPLHDAAAFGNTPSARLLLHAGLRVDLPDTLHKRTPLHEACRNGNLSLVRKMVTICPEALWICDAAGNVPVVDAAVSTNRQVVEFAVSRMILLEKRSALEAVGRIVWDPHHDDATAAIDLASVLEGAVRQQPQ